MPQPRIVSLCPSNTELIHALGLSRYLVAVDDYSDYPPALVDRLPKLGPDLNIDVAKLEALQPDLVVASLSVPGMERVVAAVKATGLPTMVLSPHGLDDVFADLRRLAERLKDWLDVDVERTVIAPLYERLQRIQEATAGIVERPRLYWEWWPRPLFSPAADNWLTELSSAAGAVNIFEDCPGQQVQDDGSRVLDRTPDYVLAVWTGIPQHKVPLDKIRHRPGWDQLPAIRYNRVYVLAEGLYCRPSPRLLDGLEQLVALLHPDLAAQLDLPPVTAHAPVRGGDGEWL
jgi:iron complex transport system substrate-binding protein